MPELLQAMIDHPLTLLAILPVLAVICLGVLWLIVFVISSAWHAASGDRTETEVRARWRREGRCLKCGTKKDETHQELGCPPYD